MLRLGVLLTGATGRDGRALAPALRDAHQLRTLHRHLSPDDPRAVLDGLQDRDVLGCGLQDDVAVRYGPGACER